VSAWVAPRARRSGIFLENARSETVRPEIDGPGNDLKCRVKEREYRTVLVNLRKRIFFPNLLLRSSVVALRVSECLCFLSHYLTTLPYFLCLSSLLRTMSALFPEDEQDPRAVLAATVTDAAAEEEGAEESPERTAHAKVQTTISEAHLMYQKYHRHHQSSTAEAKSHDHKEVPDFAMFHQVSKTGVIYATSRASAYGFDNDDPEWANMGQVCVLYRLYVR
jgi:hypothetical protein